MWVWKKGNEYGTLTQRCPQRLLSEFWGFLSPNHWEAQRPFDSIFFLPSLAWCACDFPNGGPVVLKMQSLFFPGWWTTVTSGKWGETFCRGFGDLTGWPCQLSPLLSRAEWREGGWVDVSRQPSGGGQIFSNAAWGGDPGLLRTLRHAS